MVIVVIELWPELTLIYKQVHFRINFHLLLSVSVCLCVHQHFKLFNRTTDRVHIWCACTLGLSLYSADACVEIKGHYRSMPSLSKF